MQAHSITTRPRAGSLPTALIYTRVSTDDQAREGLSLPAQLADTRRYAAGLGWELGTEYQDVLSGKRDDRPQYQALLAEVRRLRGQGKAVAVVVKWLDRFGRSVLERSRSAKELREAGVPIHSVMEGGLVSDFVYNILAAVAEEEVRRLGERVSEVRQHAKASGWHFPGRLAFGYLWRPATEEERGAGAPIVVLDEDPERAPYYREACKMILDGASIRAVAGWIQTLPDDVRQGRRFNRNCVRVMLKAAVYIARPRNDEPDVLSQPVGRWPSLIDDATWTKMQAKMADHAHMPHQASRRYLLTGLLRCPKCGGRMQGHWQKHSGTGRYYPTYICHDEQLDGTGKRGFCSYSAMTGTVDREVLDQIGKLLDTVTAPDGLQALERAWQRITEPEAAPDTQRRRRELEAIASKAQERLKRAALKLVDGDIDREAYELVREQARHDLEGAEAELARISEPEPDVSVPDLEALLELASEWRDELAEADVPEKRDLLGLLIDCVVPVRVRYAVYRAEFTWTPVGEALSILAANMATEDGESAYQLTTSPRRIGQLARLAAALRSNARRV